MSQLTDSWRTVLRRAVNTTLATGLLFLSTLGSAVTEFRVSVGSYANLENARNALAEADATLGRAIGCFQRKQQPARFIEWSRGLMAAEPAPKPLFWPPSEPMSAGRGS